MAYGAVNVALHDLIGKYEGCTVSELLGGRKQEKLRLYGSAGMYQRPEEYAAEAAISAELGFSAFKYRPALGPEEDLRTVQLMREAVGPDIGLCLMHTVGSGWVTSPTRQSKSNKWRKKLSHMGSHGWKNHFPEDHPAYTKLREKKIVLLQPVNTKPPTKVFSASSKTDVSTSFRRTFLTMVVSVQSKTSYKPQEAPIKICLHNWGTELETIADAQVGACFGKETASWLETPVTSIVGSYPLPFPLADEILKERLYVENGDLTLPDTPGLGVDVDESVIEKYPINLDLEHLRNPLPSPAPQPQR